jgi:hypothetical protein
MKFKALIDGVHFDPKKGAVKIVLIGASHVSLDELITLSPKDETVQVTLESEQAKIGVFTLNPKDPITLDEEAAERLKDAAERLRDGDKLKAVGKEG